MESSVLRFEGEVEVELALALEPLPLSLSFSVTLALSGEVAEAAADEGVRAASFFTRASMLTGMEIASVLSFLSPLEFAPLPEP